MNCSEAIDLMDLALEDHIESALRAPFEEHLTECAPCHTYYEQLWLTRGALRHLRGRGATSPRRAELIDRFRKEHEEESD